MTRVIVLRPEPGASETVARATARGIESLAIPMFHIEPLEWRVPDPEQFDAMLLTSANAARFGGPGLAELRSLPVHAVGEATAAAAREAGFEVAGVGDQGAERLLDSLGPRLRLLHLCGEDRAVVSRPVTSVAVYRSRLLDPEEELRRAQAALVLIHSPRAARSFADAADRLGLDRTSIRIAAISPAAAEAAGTGWAAVESAAEPTDEALLALAERLCDKDARE